MLYDVKNEYGISELKYWIAQSEEGPIYLIPKMGNRHGLIAGATGTGKTVTLQVLAETFSQAGVPCFMSDMKGDLSGVSQPGKLTDFIDKRCREFGIENPPFSGCPVRFFDVFGKQGHQLRATISDMGPILLSRLLDLNPTQTGILNIVFKIADDEQLILTDMKDLRAMLEFVSKHAKEIVTKYGNVTPQSIGAIQRGLLTLESQGGDKFFGEPAFDVKDFIVTDARGRGMLNILAADELMRNPKLYSTFLLWLLTSLYEEMPEVGDLDQPRLVFFFDEAHTLFDGTPKALVDQIEQVVRLIRSKGVGVYFITQLPTDIPATVLGQLGNRVQHALHAFTPKDQKAVKTAAETFRPNPKFKTVETIQNLGIGEALVSFLDETGTPGIVERSKILFPLSQIGAISEDQRYAMITSSPLGMKYDKAVDNISAYEQLHQQMTSESQSDLETAHRRAKEELKQDAKSTGRPKREPDSIFTKAAKSAAQSASREVARQVANTVTKGMGAGIGKKVSGSIVRSVIGTLMRSVVGGK